MAKSKKILGIKIPDEAKDVSWLKDLKLWLRDCWFFGRDIFINASHLVARGIKIISAISVWGKKWSAIIEALLKILRMKLRFWG